MMRHCSKAQANLTALPASWAMDATLIPDLTDMIAKCDILNQIIITGWNGHGDRLF